jgi:hypothetical protein
VIYKNWWPTELPALSQKQRAWAFAVKGPAWAKAHHFDTKGRLPVRVRRRAAKKALKH